MPALSDKSDKSDRAERTDQGCSILGNELSLRGVRDEAIPWGRFGAFDTGIASSRTPRNDNLPQNLY